MFTPGASWSPGCDCYFKTYRLFVPVRITEETVFDWLEKQDQRNVKWINDDHPT